MLLVMPVNSLGQILRWKVNKSFNPFENYNNHFFSRSEQFSYKKNCLWDKVTSNLLKVSQRFGS